MAYFTITQEDNHWNVYDLRRPNEVVARYNVLELAERQVAEWSSKLTAREEHIMDQTGPRVEHGAGYISRYRIGPEPDLEEPWGIFDYNDFRDTHAIYGYPTREECERKVHELDRADMAEIDSKEWAKQALAGWLSQVAAKYGLQPDEILYDVRFGIENALDELGFPQLG